MKYQITQNTAENHSDPGSTLKSTKPVSLQMTVASSKTEETPFVDITDNNKEMQVEDQNFNEDPGSTLKSTSHTREPATSSENQLNPPLLDTQKTEESMKNYRLSTFEMEIIELFDIPKEILESTTENRSSLPATSIDLSLAAFDEKTCFLDLLEDGIFL